MSGGNASRQPDRGQARRAFGAAAGSYDASAALQDTVRARLLQRPELDGLAPARVLDLGSGTGKGAQALQRRYPAARVMGVDFAEPMAQATGRRGDTLQAIAADAARLPLRSQSVDLVFSSLALQWCGDLGEVFGECRRVLRPGGLLLFATLGPDTLRELRAAWAEVDDYPHVHEFLDADRVAQALSGAALTESGLSRENQVMTYADLRGLTDGLRGLGAVNAAAGRARGLTGKGRLRRLRAAYEAFRDADGRLPATYEVIYGCVRLSRSVERPVQHQGWMEAAASAEGSGRL